MRKLLVNQLFIICLSALLFACLVAGITGAYYTAKNEATGSLIFDKGLIFEFTNITSDTTGLSGTLKYYENGDETTTPKSLVSISTDANATYVLAKPQILAKAKSTPFYARIKLETTFYTTNASGEYVSATASTLGAESEQAVYDALFAQNITFASRWQLANDGYYYYCGEDSASVSASDHLALINPNDTVDVFDNNVIQIGSWTSLFGGPYGISKVELLLTLDVVEQEGLTWSPEPLRSYIPLSALTYTLERTEKIMAITKIASGQTCVSIAPKYVIDGTTYTVMTIGNGRDAVNTTITEIELPNTITAIVNRAFEGCKLTSIALPDSV